MSIVALAFYSFCEIKDPTQEIQRWQHFLSRYGARGRIYLNGEGINAQMSIAQENLQPFLDWFHQDPPIEVPDFRSVSVKIDHCLEHPFPKLTIKFRKELVVIGQDWNKEDRGVHLNSQQWREKIMDRDENTVIVDVRNDYEWDLGHFEGALRPPCSTFREFPSYVEELCEKFDREKTQILMYCTGGIRCESFSSLCKQNGFKNVFQLDGGVIQYGLDQGSAGWKGKLFVFDDRLSVPVGESDEGNIISHCLFCKEKSDLYLNCANMDCNKLFICCPLCKENQRGCCSDNCLNAPRIRPFSPDVRPVPFRKLSPLDKQSL